MDHPFPRRAPEGLSCPAEEAGSHPAHVVEAFEPGRRYPEKEVNQILLIFNEDTARLRRRLIEFKLMEREGGGGEYWRVK